MNENHVIPDEAVEAAAKAYYERGGPFWADVDPAWREEEMSDFRAALEAAAPHLMAHALNEAAGAFENLPSREGSPVPAWDRATAVERLRERAIRSTQAPTFHAKESSK